MDGTLMGSDSRVSPTTRDILNGLIDENDILFTVATARTPATVVPLMSEVKTTMPYIVLAGAAMWDSVKGEFVDVQSIPHDTVRAIAAIFEKHGLHPFIYRQHGNVIHAHTMVRCRYRSRSLCKSVSTRLSSASCSTTHSITPTTTLRCSSSR